MAPRFLKEIRLRLARGGFAIDAWTTRDLRQHAGISYSRIASLERAGDIAVRRNEKGRLVFSAREVFFILLIVELALRERLDFCAEKVAVAKFLEPIRRAA